MNFTILRLGKSIPSDVRDCAFLREDRWDDWGKYQTMFTLIVINGDGRAQTIGSVKIGQVGLLPGAKIESGQRAPEIPENFSVLDERFFSIGQGENYYEELNILDISVAAQILEGLRDCAYNLQIFDSHIREDVMSESLLRGVRSDNVRSKLHRLAHGDATLTGYKFKYTPVGSHEAALSQLEFVVTPESLPPTNIHVLIGRNGVGKTRCLTQFIEALLGRESSYGGSPGEVQLVFEHGDKWAFSGVVLVSFSSFDMFDATPTPSDKVTLSKIGLQNNGVGKDDLEVLTKIGSSPSATIFRCSLENCRQGVRASRWMAAVKTLEIDDLFAEANVASLVIGPYEGDWGGLAERLFDRLSSGHKIILLTITRLVELIDEKTLVLLDEPEGHLHPPLLSAFIRCLSDLLVKRNGVGIIATHSPVVLQEVPAVCAWKLRRSGSAAFAERPTIETFGENIGVLTREVFGLEVTRSGYHHMIRQEVDRGGTYQEVISRFSYRLGAEARAIIQALIAERDDL